MKLILFFVFPEISISYFFAFVIDWSVRVHCQFATSLLILVVCAFCRLCNRYVGGTVMLT